jgi:hypothetical protein
MSNIREAKHTYNQLVAVLCDFVGSLNSFRIGLDVFWAVTFIAAPTEACSLRGDGAVDHVRSPPSTARKVLGENAPSARRVRASPTTPTVKNQSFLPDLGLRLPLGLPTKCRIHQLIDVRLLIGPPPVKSVSITEGHLSVRGNYDRYGALLADKKKTFVCPPVCIYYLIDGLIVGRK